MIKENSASNIMVQVKCMNIDLDTKKMQDYILYRRINTAVMNTYHTHDSTNCTENKTSVYNIEKNLQKR